MLFVDRESGPEVTLLGQGSTAAEVGIVVSVVNHRVLDTRLGQPSIDLMGELIRRPTVGVEVPLVDFEDALALGDLVKTNDFVESGRGVFSGHLRLRG